MKKILILFLFLVFCITIALPTNAMEVKAVTPTFTHSYKGKDYTIHLEYDFYLKESAFEKYEADISFQKQTYTILYLSIEKDYLFEENGYLVETFILDDEQVIYFRDFMNSKYLYNLSILENVSEELIMKNSKISNYIRMEFLNNKIQFSSPYNLQNTLNFGPNNGIIEYPTESLSEQAARLALTDDYLDDYDPYKDIQYDNNTGRYSENSIVNIIPKGYFFKTGKVSYIGKEYGYFMNTISKASGIFDTDVILFDIDYERVLSSSNPTNDCFMVSVQPLFAAKYTSYDKVNSSYDNTTWNKYFGNSLSIVIRNSYVDDYVLSDLELTLDLRNTTELNPGDIGYVSSSDRGDIIKNVKLEIYKPKNMNNQALKSISLFMGMIPSVGTLSSAIFAFLDLNNTENNQDDHEPENQQVHSVYLGTYISVMEDPVQKLSVEYSFASTYDNQVKYYGSLIKSCRLCTSTKIDANNNIFSDNMNKIQVKYSRQLNSKIVATYDVVGRDISTNMCYNNSYFSLSLKLYSDNSYIDSVSKKSFMETYKRV